MLTKSKYSKIWQFLAILRDFPNKTPIFRRLAYLMQQFFQVLLSSPSNVGNQSSKPSDKALTLNGKPAHAGKVIC
jgi:hypothetical protein